MTAITFKHKSKFMLSLLVILSIFLSFLPAKDAHAIGQAGDSVRITYADGFNIRKRPTTSSERIAGALYNEVLSILRVVPEEGIKYNAPLWYEVKKSTGETGYIKASDTLQEVIPRVTTSTTTSSDGQSSTNETSQTTTTPEPTKPEATPTPIPYTPDPDEGTPAYTDAEWNALLKKFPASYHASLQKMHEDHPSWSFEPYFHDFSLEYAVDLELEVPSRNLVPYYFYEYRNSYYTKQYDAGGWYAINRDGLLFTMDPRNWLNEKYVFMYEKLSEVENAPAERRLQYMFAGNQDLLNMIPAIIAAGRAHGVSPVFIGSRILTEVQVNYGGYLTVTDPAKGALRVPTEELIALGITADPNARYYNVFNIGAYQGTNPQKNGILYAMGYNSTAADRERYSLPWDSQYKAIYGGTTFIKSDYLDRGQNTNYYMKYNLRHTTSNLRANLWHQYMGNAFAPATEASVQYNANQKAGSLDLNYTFLIPVFKSMPQNNYANPGNYYPDSVPSQQTSTGDGGEFVITVPKEFAEAGEQIRVLIESGYNLRQSPSTTATRVGGAVYNEVLKVLDVVKGDMVSGATNYWYKVQKADGTVGYLNAYPANQEVIRNTNPPVVAPDPTPTPSKPSPSPSPKPSEKPVEEPSPTTPPAPKASLGDVNGDSRISVSDIVDIRLYILGKKTFTKDQIKLSDVNKDGRVSVSDLVDIYLHILGKKLLVN